MEPISLIIGLLAGLGGGAAGALLLQRKRVEKRIEASRCELDAYREDVTRHYLKTADLVDRLTQDYKALFEHLNEGAMKQMKPDVLEQKLASRRAPPVVLGVLGRQGLPAPSSASTGSSSKTPAAQTVEKTAPSPVPGISAKDDLATDEAKATPSPAPRVSNPTPAAGLAAMPKSEPGPPPALPPAPIPLGDLPPRP